MKRLTIDEWNKWRGQGITGSEAPIIMGASPWASPNDLFLRRTGRMDPQPMNYPMQRGLKLEPIARTKYEEMVGVEVPARCLESEIWPIARASFDGLNEDVKLAIEIKCPGKEDHIQALKGKIPEKYVWQLVHQLLVSGFNSVDYVSYNPAFSPQHQLARVVFYRDMAMEKKLVEAEKKFWICLQNDTAPEPAKLQRAASTTKKAEIFPIRKSRGFLPPR